MMQCKVRLNTMPSTKSKNVNFESKLDLALYVLDIYENLVITGSMSLYILGMTDKVPDDVDFVTDDDTLFGELQCDMADGEDFEYDEELVQLYIHGEKVDLFKSPKELDTVDIVINGHTLRITIPFVALDWKVKMARDKDKKVLNKLIDRLTIKAKKI